MTILFTAVVFSIRIYVRLIRHRCKGRTKGFVPVNSDIFRYTVLQNEYVGYLRPCHTKVGHVSVRYNLADYQDAYVVGDWNDLHRMHDFFSDFERCCFAVWLDNFYRNISQISVKNNLCK